MFAQSGDVADSWAIVALGGKWYGWMPSREMLPTNGREAAVKSQAIVAGQRRVWLAGDRKEQDVVSQSIPAGQLLASLR